MAAADESPPCHLIRLPYELLKPVLAELNQHDQIITAKTCLRLWRLAYPMAYNRITVTIGPNNKESAWQHLASGVGLRYVQHLEMRSTFGDEKKSRHIEDLVAGTLIAALRRNSLLSFGFESSFSPLSTISAKTVVILLETQRQLEHMVLPSIADPSNIDFDSFLPEHNVLSNLRHITLFLAGSTISETAMRGILKRSNDLSELHFRLHPRPPNHELRIPPVLLRTPQTGSFLLSMATRLTIQDCEIGWSGSGLEATSVPLLRALALVDCRGAHYFFERLQASHFPSLSALMITGQFSIPITFESFLKEAAPLREIILESPHMKISDAAVITNHATTLELLSLTRAYERSNLEIFSMSEDQIQAMFSSLTALRHLCLSFQGCSMLGIHGSIERLDRVLEHRLTRMAVLNKLRTLRFQLDTVLFRYPKLELADLARLQRSSLFEVELAMKFVQVLRQNAATLIDEQSLEYVVATNFCSIHEAGLRENQQQNAPIKFRQAKRMLALKPTMTHKPVHELKEEIMERYAGDGYYLLEAYMVGMMKKGSYEIYG